MVSILMLSLLNNELNKLGLPLLKLYDLKKFVKSEKLFLANYHYRQPYEYELREGIIELYRTLLIHCYQ